MNSLMDNTPDVISIYNFAQGRFTFMSSSVINLRGFSAEEAMNQEIEETVVPEDFESFEKSLNENLTEFINNPNLNNHYTNEVQLLRKDKTRVWTEISRRYQYNELQEIESVSTIRSLEERKKSGTHFDVRL